MIEAAAYAGTERLDDGTRLRRPLSRSCESPAAWLTSEQNEHLAQQGAAAEVAIDARAGWRTIEMFVALLPVGWG